MPKRKRGDYSNNVDRVQDMHRKDVEEKLAHSKKVLHRAMKSGKGMYRQKLGKKVQQAKKENQEEELARLDREIVALKGLDLDKAVDALLFKTLLKSNPIAESDLLPEYVKTVAPRPEGSEEQVLALHNVISGVYNMKIVKDALGQIMNGMYIALGVPAPVANTKRKAAEKKNQVKGIMSGSNNGNSREVKATNHDRENKEGSEAEPAWEGFGSASEQEDDENHNEDLDDEELSRYEALLGGSSDEESFDENKNNLPRSTKSLRDLSITPSASPSASPEPVSKPKKVKSTKTEKVPTKSGGSTFLPTLMGGYWSGSESSASDLEDDVTAPPIRKNRPGQMARRAIWEKKYGAKANHVKKGQRLAGQRKDKDDGWDARRGAKDSSDRGRGRGRNNAGGRERNFSQVTGENAIAVQPRKRGMGRRDDAGELHGSWQAAKKAKEAQKMATFQGKKVTFD